MNDSSFISDADAQLATEFIENGYVIRPVEDASSLDRIQEFVASTCLEILGTSTSDEAHTFLDNIQDQVQVDNLNSFRLSVFNAMKACEWFRPTYFSLASNALESLVGNELAMQRSINLSIQLPNDDSSLLPVHADVLNGDSPFEVVLWVPLVDCHHTKSMYILPPAKNKALFDDFQSFSGASSEEIYSAVENDVTFLDVPFGSYLLFSQNLMHGNRVNREAETRWSMNCRFKSLFSPYADKKFGEFFEPITMKPATRLGLDYRNPDFSNEK